MARRFGRPRQGRTATPEAPNPLDALLEEMRDLRLTLAADLTAAAGAADAGAEDIAAEIVDADRVELARFARLADQRLNRLQRLATAPPDAPRWRRRVVVALPAVPVVGAMALSAAAATGALPLPHHGPSPTAQPSAIVTPDDRAGGPVTSSFNRLVDVLHENPSASQVIEAASKLHRQIRHLMAVSTDDPRKAERIAELLRMEQSLLMRAQPPGVAVVLDQTRRLAARLVTAVPSVKVSPTAVPPHVTLQHPGNGHKTHTHDNVPAQPTQPAAPTASPKPTHESSQSPSPSPSPSSSPDDPFGHLPG